MSGVDDLFQQLSHIGSALGPIGVALAGWLNRAVSRLTADAEEAKKIAGEAKTIAGEAKASSTTASQSFENIRGGLRLDLASFKTDVEQKMASASVEMRAMAQQLVQQLLQSLEERMRRLERDWQDAERGYRGSRPEGGYENDAHIVALRSTLEHEKEQRVALQQTLTSHMTAEADRWLKMERFVGNIETNMETWKRLEARIDALEGRRR